MAVALGGTWPAFRNAHLGPFEGSDGALYAAVWRESIAQGDPTRVEILRSADQGATWGVRTSWDFDDQTFQQALDVVQVGDVLYVMAGRNSIASIRSFDVAAVAWGTETAAINIYEGLQPGVSPAFLMVRSATEMLVFHQGPKQLLDSVEWRRHVYSKWESGSWVATNVALYTTGITEHHDLRGALLGADGESVHVFWSSPSYDGAWHRLLKADDTFGGHSTLEGSFTVDELANYLVGQPTLHGTEVIAPYVEGSSTSPRRPVAARTSVVDPATADWDRTGLIANAEVDSTNTNPIVAVSVEGVVYALYVDLNGDLYIAHDQGTNTWSASELLFTGTVLGACALPVTGGIGFLYNDNGVPTFGKFDIATYNGPWQYLRPDADVAAGTWTVHDGSTVGLFDAVNEEVADDLDYIKVAP